MKNSKQLSGIELTINESTVLDAPNFKKKIVIKNSEIIDLGENEAKLIIKDVELIEK